MNMKKILCSALAASMAMSFAAVIPASAANAGVSDSGSKGSVRFAQDFTNVSASTLVNGRYVINGDEEAIATIGSGFKGNMYNGTVSLDGINPNQTFYIRLGLNNGTASDAYSLTNNNTIVSARDLVNEDLFKLSFDKNGDGKKVIKSVTQYDDKNFGAGRGSYLKVVLGDSTTTEDLKADWKIEFRARKDANVSSGKDNAVDPNSTYKSGDIVTLNLNLWINNTKETSDNNPDAGDRIYFDPTKNDSNALIWGDDIAALKFAADSSATKFYCRLSTKTDSEFYSTYGDPVNADLYFFDFVSNPTIPSTSRATLTLGIPWNDDEDDLYIPDPTQCYIYAKDADGYVVDVTEEFVYSEDAAEIPGWSTKTRMLGTYIISDTMLDIDVINDEVVTLPDDVLVPPVTDDKLIPNTGSSDMVSLAIVAAVVSLAAAGAVAFKKSSK